MTPSVRSFCLFALPLLLVEESSRHNIMTCDLVSVSSLPEMSLLNCSAIVCVSRFGVLCVAVLAMHPRRAAGKENKERSDKEEDHGYDESPHTCTVRRGASTAITVDVSLNDAEEDEISDQDDDCDEPCDESRCSCEDRTAETGA